MSTSTTADPQIALVAVIVLMCATTCRGAKATTFDGHWWIGATSDEQSGFLSGESDCSRAELGLKQEHSHSLPEERAYVTEFYRAKSDKLSVPVVDALRTARGQVLSKHARSGGEAWPEAHAYWDGQWWREGTAGERLGYVEGYLACYSGASTRHGSFQKPPSDYVRMINEWYRLKEETGDVDPQRVDTKIAEVLFKFRDDSKGP
jgi:hypothetical protein